MTRKVNVRAILESMFPQLKDELIDIAVENIMSLKHEPCTDAVSREAVLDIVNNPLNIRLDEIIKNLPSVTPDRPKGHWIPIPYQLEYETDAVCSVCHEPVIAAADYKYCPRCGFEMVKGGR